MDEDDYRDETSDDPARAFERLRGEVSLLRSAIEGLTAARESIDIPDYEPTLARTEKVLAVLAQQIDGVRKSPAMTLTPENMGSRLNASVMETVNTLRASPGVENGAGRDGGRATRPGAVGAHRPRAEPMAVYHRRRRNPAGAVALCGVCRPGRASRAGELAMARERGGSCFGRADPVGCRHGSAGRRGGEGVGQRVE